MRFFRSAKYSTQFRWRDYKILQNTLKVCALTNTSMRHGVPLRNNLHELTEQRLGNSPAKRKRHRNLTTCALTAIRRHASPRTQPQGAGRRSFLDLKNRRSRSCASGAYSTYVRMAHERDRRFLWLKSDGNSPTLTDTLAHKPTIHAFRDRIHNQISRKLPTRTH